MARLPIAELQLDHHGLSLPSASYLEKSKHGVTVDYCKDERFADCSVLATGSPPAYLTSC